MNVHGVDRIRKGSLRGVIAAAAALSLVGGAGPTWAGPGGATPEEIYTFQNPFFFDLNGTGVWNGNAGGDASFALAAFAGAGISFIGDWNGDTIEAAGRYVGTTFYLDFNENNAWNGNAMGDRATNFAAGFGAGTPLIDDWGGTGTDKVGVYTAADRFLLDLNGNGIWNGQPTDRNTAIAAFAGVGVPLSGNFSGDVGGIPDLAKYVGTTFYVDLNGNGAWNGNAGGDRATNFAAGFGAGTPIVGDWDGDGTDEIGVYTAADRFLLDLNGNGIWDGNGGGDLNTAIAAFVGVQPIVLVCDFDGDGDDEIGKFNPTTSTFYLDLNGNLAWNGNAGGDFAGPWAVAFGTMNAAGCGQLALP